MTLVVFIFFHCSTSNPRPAISQVNPLITYTFYELGYNTTETYHQDEGLILPVNCSGSPLELYSAKIHLHITGEDTLYSYWINDGPLRSGGSNPGCSFFSGWQETYLEPGHFQEGVNTLRVVIKNCDDDPLSTTSKYLMIITDSYIEIFEGSEVLTTAQETRSTEIEMGINLLGFLPLTGFILLGLLGMIGIGGYLLIMNRKRGETIFYQPPYEGMVRQAFHCQLDDRQHPTTDSAYQCKECSRMVCADCYSLKLSVGVSICPFCQGELIKIQ